MVLSNWILLTFVYAVMISLYNLSKKKALKDVHVIDVLLIFPCIAFLLVSYNFKEAITLDITNILLIACKSIIISIAWILSYKVIKNISVGLYGILEAIRIIFSYVLAIIVLGESLTLNLIIGSMIVVFGIYFANKKDMKTNVESKVSKIHILFMIIASFLNSMAGTFDKYITRVVTPNQLQFWFLFFIFVFFLIYVLVTQRKVEFKKALSNKYVWLIGICLVLGDMCLFRACAIPESSVMIMSVIKRFSTVMLIIWGQLFLKEKDTLYKIMCALIIIFGIIVAAL